MYITYVIPLIKIPRPNPQVLTYFCTEKILVGGLVKISIRNKKIKAIVIEQKKLEKEKIRLKKLADFQIKPIEKIISQEPVLTEKQLKLLFWIADYYFAPLGLFAKIFLTKKFMIHDSGFRIQKLNLTPQMKSLVFAPWKKLNTITIKHHESDLYRSWGRRPYYDVRKIAKQLAKIHKAELILKSEFLKQDTRNKKQDKKLVDMREEIKNGNFSVISKELQQAIDKNSKSILYIARRGTSTFVLCRECGYVSMCPDCDVPMVFHEGLRPTFQSLLCHHCGKQDIAPVLCPKCKGAKIKYFGAGTQKVETEIKKLFPNRIILRLDSDVAEKPAQQQRIIEKFNRSKKAILIGSQMLFNKNLKADLVAVVSIETILNLPDYRSSERAFKTIYYLQQMAKKQFLVQTYNPENYTIKNALANNYKNFYNQELKIRKKFIYPPFSQLIKLTFEHKNPEKAKNEARILFEKLKTQIKSIIHDLKFMIQLFGPVPAFIPRIAGKYQWNIVIKSKIKSQNLKLRNRLLMIVPSTWEIEVDPDSLL